MSLRRYLATFRRTLLSSPRARRPQPEAWRPLVESLEDRTLLSVFLSNIPTWAGQGPGPTTNGQTVGLTNNPVVGAVNAVATDPSNADNLYAATVDGGIWHTTNATSATPNWTPLTDQLPSLAVSTIAFSPLDPSRQTLFAGTGGFSSGFGVEGSIGLLRTTDGGAHWTILGQGVFSAFRVNSVMPTSINLASGQVVLVATDGGLFYSNNGGNSFQATAVLAGKITDMVADPGNSMRFYAGVANQGVYQSIDGGQTWTAMNNGITGAASASIIKLSVGNSATANVVYAALQNGGTTAGVFKSSDQAANWRQVQNFQQPNASGFGGFGRGNLSIQADQADPTVFFIAGDDQATSPFVGIIFRVTTNDATPSSDNWQSVVQGGANGTAPHADDRSLTFDAQGNLLETDDGGIYRLTSPDTGARAWASVNGTLQVTEFYSVAYETANGIIFGGAQDTGSPQQDSTGSSTWNEKTELQGDGGIQGVDNTNHIRYSFSDNFNTFRRRTYDTSDNELSDQQVLLASSTTAAALSGLNAADTAVDTANQFVLIQFAINNVNPARMVIGGNGLYEDDQTGAAHSTGDVIKTLTGTGQTGVSALAYGGMQNGTPNAEVLYVGFGNGTIYLRTAAGDTFTKLNYPGGAPTRIVMDPDNYQTAYVEDGTDVYVVTNAGAAGENWQKLTNNLNKLASQVASLEVVKTGGQTVLLAGGLGGVFRGIYDGVTAPIWSQYGTALPNAQVKDLHYYAADDLLLAGTYGRGAWIVTNASTTLTVTGVLQVNGDTDFAGENDTIRLVRDTNNPSLLDVFLNNTTNTPDLSVPLSAVQQINVNGLGGNDTLIVDDSNGLISVSNGINYDGGTGFNTLQLVQTGGTAQTSDVYSVGPNPGEGTDVINGPGGTQTVFFQNLAPVTDLVLAATLTVNATPSDNAISYTAGSLITNGKVTIDNFEPIEFSNKDNLVINSLGGTDTVSVNNPNTPTGATAGGLKGITLTGGDPTSFDTLVVNGVGATVGVNVGTRSLTGATGTGGAVPITYNTFESLVVNAGPSTTLAVSGSPSYVTTPATAADAGTIQTSTIPITFTGIGSGKTLGLTSSGGGASLVVNGTTGDDSFTVDASGHVTLAGRATIAPTSLPNLTLNGLDGSDTVGLTGNGGDLTANLGGATASVSGAGLGGGLTSVALSAVEVLNLSAGAGAITLAGTLGPDAFTVTPTGANTATAQANGLAPTVNTTNTGPLSVNADGGSDSLTVNATSAADTINVDGGSSTVSIVGLKTIGYSNVESLNVFGLAGSDTFNVTAGGLPIFIDGGDPIGILPGDLLNILAGGQSVTFTPGPQTDEGGIDVGSNPTVSFDHIESIAISGGGPAVINGTNGPDAITITARDSSYNALADGVQDFTVSVNTGPDILFLDTAAVTVNALAGSDQVTLVTPAPNNAVWNVQVTVNGGAPAADTDRLIVQTPGTTPEAATYTPTASDGGTLNLTTLTSLVTLTGIEALFFDGQSNNDSLTVVGTAGPDTITHTPGANDQAGTFQVNTLLPIAYQNLGSGGSLTADGAGGADTLVYNGTAGNDAFVVGTAGQISLNSRLPVNTANIEALTLQGFAGDDTFTLVPTISADVYTTLTLLGGDQASAAGDQASLTAGASGLINVSGQTISQGGKTAVGGGLENINLDGAGNHLTYNGVLGVTENITIAASPTANQGQISVPGAVQLTFLNVPALDAVGNPADNDTLAFAGTNNDDTFQVNLAAAGTVGDPVLKLQDPTANLLLTLTNYTGFTTLGINGLNGSDTFNVYVAPTGPGRHIAIDGGLDTGKKKATDVLNVFYVNKPHPKIIHSAATQNPTSGLVSVDYGPPFFLIEYAGIENVTIHQQ